MDVPFLPFFLFDIEMSRYFIRLTFLMVSLSTCMIYAGESFCVLVMKINLGLILISPLARRTFQTAGPVRASTFYVSLARTDHLTRYMSGHQISNNAGPNDAKS